MDEETYNYIFNSLDDYSILKAPVFSDDIFYLFFLKDFEQSMQEMKTLIINKGDASIVKILSHHMADSVIEDTCTEHVKEYIFLNSILVKIVFLNPPEDRKIKSLTTVSKDCEERKKNMQFNFKQH